MNLWVGLGVLLAYAVNLGESYSKYGRTCKDIGCLNNEVCVMENDPCSYYQRQNDCGTYPTCKKNNNADAPSCKTFVCPPTQVCRMESNRPRCVSDTGKLGHVGYDTQSASGNIYPEIPRGETTPRPNIQRPVQGGGFQGGQIGSGYPGQAQGGGGGYRPPQQPYPGQYPGYPQNNNGYPTQQQGGYYPQQPQQGYPGYPPQQQGYPQYPNNAQGGYNPYYGGQQTRYGPNNGGSSSTSTSGGLVDKITNALKSYGLFYMTVAYFYQRIVGF